jgi:uncharacterized protein YggE
MSTDTITVRIVLEAELDADSADLSVTIEGSALFSGAEAFKKAKELQVLVAALKDAKIDQDHVKLRSVELNSQGFAMIKTSSVRYLISIKNVPLERMPDVLGTVAAHKGAKLTKLKWNYGQLKPARQRLRLDALAEALQQARLDAEVLGVQLLGIHEADEENTERRYDSEYVSGYGADAIGAITSAMNEPLGCNLGNSTTVRFALRAAFRVGPLVSKV